MKEVEIINIDDKEYALIAICYDSIINKDILYDNYHVLDKIMIKTVKKVSKIS